VILITYSATFFSDLIFGEMLTMIIVLAAVLTIIIEPYKPQFGHYSNNFVVFLIFITYVFTSVVEMGYQVLLTRLINAAAGFTGILHQVYLLVLVYYWFMEK